MATVSTPPVGASLAQPIAQPRQATRAVRAGNPTIQALARTVRNPIGMFGVAVLTLLVICALGAPVLSPYVGSSSTRTRGEVASAVATDSRRCWPPERV
jgi:hypothetical protein